MPITEVTQKLVSDLYELKKIKEKDKKKLEKILEKDPTKACDNEKDKGNLLDVIV